MRVFQISPVLGSVGGIESYVQRLCRSLASRGHQTVVAVPEPVAEAEIGCKVLQVPEVAWRQARNAAANRRRILEVVSAYRPDCVLLHQMGDGGLLRTLHEDYLTVEFVHIFLCHGSKLFRRHDAVCKHTVGLRCLLDWYVGPCGTKPSPVAAIASLREAREYIRGLRAIDLVVVGSQFMKGYLAGEGLDPDRIEIVDMAAGVSPPIQPAYRTVTDPLIVCVGRLVYAKGIQYLIRALTLLDSHYRLSVVGDGWYLPALKSLAHKLGLGQRVQFLGVLQEPALSRVMKSAAVGVVPSIYPEPSGLVVAEMRGNGLPVVVTDTGGLKEWASRYPGVYVAEPASAASLAEAIRAAVETNAGSNSLCVGSQPRTLPASLEVAYEARSGRGRTAPAGQLK